MDALWIAIGAAAGANARYYAGQWVASWAGVTFPTGTLLVNISGSFLIGALATLLSERLLVPPHWRLILVVGFLGGYTTFSSFSLEVVSLLESGRWLAAAGYVASSVALGIAACAFGVLLMRTVGGRV